MDIHQTVNDYITQELLEGQEALGNDEELLGYPAIDSLAVVGLVSYLEQTFQIAVRPEDVTLENFRTVRSIAGYVDGRRATA